MNSTKQIILTAILTIAVLSNLTVGSVYATGGLDDEEEEEAILELQSNIGEIKTALGDLELNLQEGSNNIQANCPVSTQEIVEEITEVITNVTEEPKGCPLVEEPEQNQTVLPPVVAEPEPEQNETSLPGCSPVPEEEEPEQLEPIVCPLNGDLLGYKNITSGELLPISAVLNETGQGNETIPFLPPIEIPTNEQEPQQNQTVTEQPKPVESPTCNVTQQPSVEEEPPEEVIAEIEFDEGCGCFTVDKATGESTAEETS